MCDILNKIQQILNNQISYNWPLCVFRVMSFRLGLNIIIIKWDFCLVRYFCVTLVGKSLQNTIGWIKIIYVSDYSFPHFSKARSCSVEHAYVTKNVVKARNCCILYFLS